MIKKVLLIAPDNQQLLLSFVTHYLNNELNLCVESFSVEKDNSIDLVPTLDNCPDNTCAIIYLAAVNTDVLHTLHSIQTTAKVTLLLGTTIPMHQLTVLKRFNMLTVNDSLEDLRNCLYQKNERYHSLAIRGLFSVEETLLKSNDFFETSKL